MIKKSPSIVLLTTTTEKAAPFTKKQKRWVSPTDHLKYDYLL